MSFFSVSCLIADNTISANSTFFPCFFLDWVPTDVAEKCKITLEFCATRKEKPSEQQGSFVWCGLIRRTMFLSDEKKSHRARVVFLKSGEYVVSACARIVNDDVSDSGGENWWAPVAEKVVVESSDNAAQ